jgi:hypothetical protein
VILCEAYIGIESPLNLWSHFFQALLRQGPDVGATFLGSVDISVHSRSRADFYFSILQPNPSVGWKKAWFLLKIETEAPLPTFTGGRPVPHSNWE